MELKDILARVKVDFEFATKTKFVGLVRAIGSAFSSRIKEVYYKLDFVRRQAFVSTADKDYLYMHSGELVEVGGAMFAAGQVCFFGVVGTNVPANTKVEDNGVEWVTTAASKIVESTEVLGVVVVVGSIAQVIQNLSIPTCKCLVNGVEKVVTSTEEARYFDADGIADGEQVTIIVRKTLPVAVTAVKAGADGNRAFGDVLRLTTTITGIDSEAVVLSIAGGSEEEGTEDYRARVIDWLSKPQAPFNENNIIAEVKKRTAATYCWVRDADKTGGSVGVYPLNVSQAGSIGLNVDVKAAVMLIKSPQLEEERVFVATPAVEKVVFVVSGMSPTSDGLKSEIAKNLEYMMLGGRFEAGILVEEIQAEVFRAEYAGQRPVTFTVSGARSAVAEKVYFYGGVNFV